MMKQRILLIGATGYIDGNRLLRLLAAGALASHPT